MVEKALVGIIILNKLKKKLVNLHGKEKDLNSLIPENNGIKKTKNFSKTIVKNCGKTKKLNNRLFRNIRKKLNVLILIRFLILLKRRVSGPILVLLVLLDVVKANRKPLVKCQVIQLLN